MASLTQRLTIGQSIIAASSERRYVMVLCAVPSDRRSAAAIVISVG